MQKNKTIESLQKTAAILKSGFRILSNANLYSFKSNEYRFLKVNKVKNAVADPENSGGGGGMKIAKIKHTNDK